MGEGRWNDNYFDFRAGRLLIGQFRPTSPVDPCSVHAITVTDNPGGWGGPRDLAAMGLEPTTTYRLLRVAACENALTTRPPDFRKGGGEVGV